MSRVLNRSRIALARPNLWSRSPAPQGGQHLVEVVWPLQDVPRLGTFAWPDNTPALQQVHQPAGLGEPDPELALQHGRRAELAGDDQLGRGDQQLKVVADLAVDLLGLLRGRRDVLAVLDLSTRLSSSNCPISFPAGPPADASRQRS